MYQKLEYGIILIILVFLMELEFRIGSERGAKATPSR
jgi:hypothetical protein